MDAQKTLVVFRKWKNDNGIIALFPLIPANTWGWACLSYEHIGQHGAASSVQAGAATVPAKPHEYADLERELRGIGYTLEIRKRFPNWSVIQRAFDAERKRQDLTA